MQISGEYGTELLLRYSEEELLRKLERRRVAEERENHRRGEAEPARRTAQLTRRGPGSRWARIARFFLRVDTAAGGPEWIRPASTGTETPEPIWARLEPLHIDPLVIREQVRTGHEGEERTITLVTTHR